MFSVVEYVEPLAIGVGIAAVWISTTRSGVADAVFDRRAAKRGARVLMAAHAAAEDDPRFAPEHIRDVVDRILDEAQIAWRETLPGARAVKVRVTLLSLVNRPGEAEDRVALRVRVVVRRDPEPGLFRLDPTPLVSLRRTVVDERWTLGFSGGDWVLLDAGGDPRSPLPLARPVVVDPSADDERLRQESLRELAEAPPVELAWAATDKDVRTELLDRSLVDARFQPALVDAAVHRIIEAWETASSGDEDSLRAVASDRAITQLLNVESNTIPKRLAVHDLELEGIHLRRLDASQLHLTVDVRGRRYVTDAATGEWLEGSDRVSHLMPLDWELALTSDAPAQWKLTQSSAPYDAPETEMLAIRITRALRRGLGLQRRR